MLPGVVLNVGPPFVVIGGLADAGGELVASGLVPTLPGVALYAQAIAFDGASFESSQGLELLIP